MILVDAGPMVALVDESDQHHISCRDASKTIAVPLGTTWPALTEAIHLLGGFPKAQDAIWQMVSNGQIVILNLGLADIARIRELMAKYADLPMDLADATLIHVAEREGIRTIFTTDRKDFSVYRLHGRIRPKLIP